MQVEINGSTTELLNSIGHKEGREPAEIIRRAIGLYLWVSESTRSFDGYGIAILDAEGKVLHQVKSLVLL